MLTMKELPAGILESSKIPFMWRNPPHVGQLSWTSLSASVLVVVPGPWVQELIYPKESVLTFPFHFLLLANTVLNIPICKRESHASSLQNLYWKQQKGTEAETLHVYACTVHLHWGEHKMAVLENSLNQSNLKLQHAQKKQLFRLYEICPERKRSGSKMGWLFWNKKLHALNWSANPTLYLEGLWK